MPGGEEDWPEPGEMNSDFEADLVYITIGFAVWVLTVAIAAVVAPAELAEAVESIPPIAWIGTSMVFMGATGAAVKVAREGSLT